MNPLIFWNLFGGMALILFGIRLCRKGFQKVAGPHLRSVLHSLTANRLKAFGAGVLVTVMSQSSMATALMVISFMSAELMRGPQTIAIILGADVGTTLTVQLLAFRVYDYAPALIGIGACLYLFPRARSTQGIGHGILGFGLVFMGLKLMSDAALPLKESEATTTILRLLADSPFTCLLGSAIVTVILQHSAATLGIALAMSTQGLISLEQALPIMLGANVGNAVVPLIAGAGHLEARRLGVANLLMKSALALIVFFLLPFLDRLVALTSADATRQIANAHTLFNVALALVFLPLTPWVAGIVGRMVAPQPKEGEAFGPKYLQQDLLDSSPLALGQAVRETLHMGDIVTGMFRESIQVFEKDDDALRAEIQDRDDRVDILDKEIKLYLTRLGADGLTPDEEQRKLAILGFVHELENIGDIVDKNLMELAKKKIHHHYRFSKEGWDEIRDFHGKVAENLDIALAAFTNRDQELARKLLRHKEYLGDMERTLRQRHLDRLHAGVRESIETTSVHLDVLSNIKRINSHLTAVAYPILENRER